MGCSPVRAQTSHPRNLANDDVDLLTALASDESDPRGDDPIADSALVDMSTVTINSSAPLLLFLFILVFLSTLVFGLLFGALLALAHARLSDSVGCNRAAALHRPRPHPSSAAVSSGAFASDPHTGVREQGVPGTSMSISSVLCMTSQFDLVEPEQERCTTWLRVTR